MLNHIVSRAFYCGVARRVIVQLSVAIVVGLIPRVATDCGFNGGWVRSSRYRKTSSDEVALNGQK